MFGSLPQKSYRQCILCTIQGKACLVKVVVSGYCAVCCCSSRANAVPEISLSLCGTLNHQDTRISNDVFNRDLITHEALCENPALLSDPNLVVRVGSKYVKLLQCGKFHNMYMCLVVYNFCLLKTS